MSGIYRNEVESCEFELEKNTVVQNTNVDSSA